MDSNVSASADDDDLNALTFGGDDQETFGDSGEWNEAESAALASNFERMRVSSANTVSVSAVGKPEAVPFDSTAYAFFSTAVPDEELEGDLLEALEPDGGRTEDDDLLAQLREGEEELEGAHGLDVNKQWIPTEAEEEEQIVSKSVEDALDDNDFPADAVERLLRDLPNTEDSKGISSAYPAAARTALGSGLPGGPDWWNASVTSTSPAGVSGLGGKSLDAGAAGRLALTADSVWGGILGSPWDRPTASKSSAGSSAPAAPLAGGKPVGPTQLSELEAALLRGRVPGVPNSAVPSPAPHGSQRMPPPPPRWMDGAMPQKPQSAGRDRASLSLTGPAYFQSEHPSEQLPPSFRAPSPGGIPHMQHPPQPPHPMQSFPPPPPHLVGTPGQEAGRYGMQAGPVTDRFPPGMVPPSAALYSQTLPQRTSSMQPSMRQPPPMQQALTHMPTNAAPGHTQAAFGKDFLFPPAPVPPPGYGVPPSTAPAAPDSLRPGSAAGGADQREPEADSNNFQANRRGPPRGGVYMSTQEVQSIIRMQMAASHPSNPYSDDYYYMAHMAKMEGNTGTSNGRRVFAPPSLRESISSRTLSHERHSFLQVEGLGRVNFSSLRAPRPLLELEESGLLRERGPGENGDGEGEYIRPLEEEPMLAVRTAIEDAVGLLLDVDDVDRFMATGQVFAQAGIGGTGGMTTQHQLQKRRYAILEAVVSILHIPKLTSAATRETQIADIAFQRIVALAKGRKLVARVLQLSPPGSQLATRVVLSVARNVPALFGHMPPQLPRNASYDAVNDFHSSTTKVASTTAAHIGFMELPGLVALLAYAIPSLKQVPLQPIHYPGSPGNVIVASATAVILRAIFERASVLLDARSGGPPPPAAQVQSWLAVAGTAFTVVVVSATGSLNSRSRGPIDVDLIRSMIPHCSPEQMEQVRWCLAAALESSNMRLHPTHQPPQGQAMGNVRHPAPPVQPPLHAVPLPVQWAQPAA